MSSTGNDVPADSAALESARARGVGSGVDGGLEGGRGGGGAAGPVDRDAMPRWVPRAIFLFFAGVVALYVGRWLLVHLRTLLLLLLVSLFLSFAMEPAVNNLARRGWRRGSATGLVFLIVLVLIGLFVFAIGQLIAEQVNDFVDNAPEYVDDVVNFINEKFDTDIKSDELTEQITQEDSPVRRAAENLANNAVALSFTVVGVLFQILAVALFTFYFVADGPRLRRAICGLLPPRHQREVLRAWELAIEKTGQYIYSRALLALASGIAHGVFMEIIGVPYPLALAVWVGVMSQFVPVIGTYIAGALPVLIALVQRPSTALWMLVFVVGYQQFENYLLLPRITAQTLEIHPAVAFGSVIAGAGMLGPVGAVLSLPAAAVFQAFISTYLPSHEVIDSRLTEEVARRRRRLWPRRWSRGARSTFRLPDEPPDEELGGQEIGDQEIRAQGTGDEEIGGREPGAQVEGTLGEPSDDRETPPDEPDRA
jgi:predicted PurR-regulated permease PerM